MPILKLYLYVADIIYYTYLFSKIDSQYIELSYFTGKRREYLSSSSGDTGADSVLGEMNLVSGPVILLENISQMC